MAAPMSTVSRRPAVSCSTPRPYPRLVARSTCAATTVPPLRRLQRPRMRLQRPRMRLQRPHMRLERPRRRL
eukprot:5085548-Pyramimonas_sp.AAC.1